MRCALVMGAGAGAGARAWTFLAATFCRTEGSGFRVAVVRVTAAASEVLDTARIARSEAGEKRMFDKDCGVKRLCGRGLREIGTRWEKGKRERETKRLQKTFKGNSSPYIY